MPKRKPAKSKGPNGPRGLTWAGYRRLWRRIKLGELTWEDAERLKLCKPRGKSGPARKDLEAV